MAEITAALVKELREKTGAGMMDCKKALTENSGDLDAAIDWLRTKGLSQAAKKASRVASEGLVGLKVAGTRGAVVEVNSEEAWVPSTKSNSWSRTRRRLFLVSAGSRRPKVSLAVVMGH